MTTDGSDSRRVDPARVEEETHTTRPSSTIKIPKGTRDPDEDLENNLQDFRQSQDTPDRVEGFIGSGGMGTIELVFDPRLRRRLARKALAAEYQSDAESFQDFIREARITGRLEHPNIVPVHDLRIDAHGKIAFTMKRIQGQTLEDMIHEAGPRRFDHGFMYKFLDILTRVCEAVAYAHSQNILHLDIKPENIMVGDFGQVYLMDWGIARIKGRIPVSPDGPCIVGTPIYMPPEQAQALDELLDERSDIFTLGGTLYEFLTLHAPFQADSIRDAIFRAQDNRYPDPTDHVTDPRMPLALCRIVRKAMAAEREDRYASVLDLREDILQFMRGGFEFPTVSHEAGTRIIEQGQVGEEAFIIVSGQCRVLVSDGDGERELAQLGPGAIFGEMAILSAAPRAASVETTEPTELMVINRTVIEQELDSMKPWMGALIRAFARHATDDS